MMKFYRNLFKSLRILMLLLISCMLMACGSLKPEYNKKQIEPVLYRIVDSSGVELRFSQKPQRIISLSISTDEILLDLVESERIAALTYLVDDSGISNVVEQAKAVKNRVKDTSPEAIMKLKPDLIIIPDFVKPETIRSLREMDINVYVYKTPSSLQEIMTTILEVGTLVNEEKRAEKIVSQMQKSMQVIEQRVSIISKNSMKRVILLRDGGAYFRPESSFNDICKHAMVKNALEELGYKKPVMVNQEEIVRLNPDVFLLMDWNGSEVSKDVENDNPYLNNAYNNVKAMKDRAVYVLPSRHLLCLSQYTVEAIKDIAEVAYGIKDPTPKKGFLINDRI